MRSSRESVVRVPEQTQARGMKSICRPNRGRLTEVCGYSTVFDSSLDVCFGLILVCFGWVGLFSQLVRL